MITGIKKKGLSSIVSAIILIVVIVILVIIILSWGKDFTLKGTEKTKIIFEETKDYLISNPILQDNYLAFKNISANNKSVTIVGYKILSTSEDSNFNSDIMLDEPIVINPGATGIISLIKLPSERKITIELLTEDYKKITLNINNTNPSSEKSEEDQEPQISSEKNIIYFTINDTNGTIDSDLNTITFEFTYGTDITTLTPTIIISDDATISPKSEISQDFTNPLEYTVTAEDKSTKIYTIIITILDIPVPDGIEEIPINGEIWYLEHLDYIDTNATTLAGTYTLMRDLNFSDDSSYYNVDNKATWTTGGGWMPLGTSAAKFTGTFNGNSKIISNLFINRSSTDYVGLFGYTESTTTINNLWLIDGNVIGRDYTAGIIGYQNYGTLTNNSVNAIITGRNYVGGIAGQNNYGTISKCYSLGTIAASSYVGGVVGRMSGTSTVSDSYSTMNVLGETGTGGLVGYMSGATSGWNARILRSYSTGYVRGAYHGENGGLVGSSGSYTSITNSYWDMNTSTRLTSAAGTGKTSEDLKQQATFNTWNFSTTWAINQNNSYPYVITNTQSPAPTPINPPEPTMIYTAEDLYNIRNDTNRTAHYKLANDIDLGVTPYNTGEGWSAIGTSANKFNAILDGDNHKIINLYINKPTTDYQGLFGYLGSSAYVINLEFENANVTARDYTGIVAGHSDRGYISNNKIAGNVIGRDYTAGIVGYQTYGTQIDNTVNTIITGRNYVGGLAGQQDYGTISKCYSLGLVIATSYVGGVVGRMSGTSTVSDSYSTMNVLGETGTGGLVGYMSGATSGWNARILRSYSTGYVRGAYHGENGGLVGSSGSYTSITNSYWDMNTSTRLTSAAGTGKTSEDLKQQATFNTWNFSTTWAINQNNSYPYVITNTQSPAPTPINPPEPTMIYTAEDLYNIRNDTNRTAHYKLANDIDLGVTPYNTGEGWSAIGTSANKFNAILDGDNHKIINLYINKPTTDYQGLFGYLGSSAYVINLEFENANVTARDYTGIVAGHSDRGYISNNKIAGNVIGRDYTAGIVGYQTYGTQIDNTVNTIITGRNYVGGLAGRQDYGTISKCYSLGSVIATSYVGGVVGRMSGTSTVSNSYSSAQISGSYAGGLVGYMSGATSGWNAQVLRSYSIGPVSGTTNLGGLVGGVGSYTSFTNSFWDMNTSGKATSGGGTGKTTTQMKTQSTFTSWDFTTIWNITASTTYPYLRSNTQSPLPE